HAGHGVVPFPRGDRVGRPWPTFGAGTPRDWTPPVQHPGRRREKKPAGAVDDLPDPPGPARIRELLAHPDIWSRPGWAVRRARRPRTWAVAVWGSIGDVAAWLDALRRRLPPRIVWTPAFQTFTLSIILSSVADALIAVSLAGSLFFSLSPEA